MARSKRKLRLSRMDAAIDAMEPLGFEETIVRTSVKKLLIVYGGPRSWRWIEENGYRVLIDFILDETTETSEEKDKEEIEDDLLIEKGVIMESPRLHHGQSSYTGHLQLEESPRLHHGQSSYTGHLKIKEGEIIESPHHVQSSQLDYLQREEGKSLYPDNMEREEGEIIPSSSEGGNAMARELEGSVPLQKNNEDEHISPATMAPNILFQKQTQEEEGNNFNIPRKRRSLMNRINNKDRRIFHQFSNRGGSELEGSVPLQKCNGDEPISPATMAPNILFQKQTQEEDGNSFDIPRKRSLMHRINNKDRRTFRQFYNRGGRPLEGNNILGGNSHSSQGGRPHRGNSNNNREGQGCDTFLVDNINGIKNNHGGENPHSQGERPHRGNNNNSSEREGCDTFLVDNSNNIKNIQRGESLHNRAGRPHRGDNNNFKGEGWDNFLVDNNNSIKNIRGEGESPHNQGGRPHRENNNNNREREGWDTFLVDNSNNIKNIQRGENPHSRAGRPHRGDNNNFKREGWDNFLVDNNNSIKNIRGEGESPHNRGERPHRGNNNNNREREGWDTFLVDNSSSIKNIHGESLSQRSMSRNRNSDNMLTGWDKCLIDNRLTGWDKCLFDNSNSIKNIHGGESSHNQRLMPFLGSKNCNKKLTGGQRWHPFLANSNSISDNQLSGGQEWLSFRENRLVGERGCTPFRGNSSSNQERSGRPQFNENNMSNNNREIGRGASSGRSLVLKRDNQGR